MTITLINHHGKYSVKQLHLVHIYTVHFVFLVKVVHHNQLESRKYHSV